MNEKIDPNSMADPEQFFLGVEFGSTRIKAVLIDGNHVPVVSGSHDWENKLVDGVWTYGLEEIWTGLQDCYAKLKDAYQKKYSRPLTSVSSMGFSAMMHGYMAFDKTGKLMVPFRTWRNTSTGPAAAELSKVFNFNIPQRWSIAHLYQAILNEEPHVGQITFLTTLAGYIHWKLTDKKVLGVGDASGMFPVDSRKMTYDGTMLKQFDQLIEKKKLGWRIEELLPKVLNAGDAAGTLTEAGAKLLDPSGDLKPGIPLCPPEGDAGTGMVATNSVAARTCNVSAGTSIFAMVVLEKSLSKLYEEIDMVTTPSGKPVAMVHANTCTSDLNAWVALFKEFSDVFGVKIEPDALYTSLFNQALKGDADCGGLLAYNFFSGEPITHLDKGAPLFVRTADSHFNLANFMRVHLFSALGTLKLGMEILFDKEKVKMDQVLGHGGFFKTPEVGQRIMAAALNVPVSVMETAGEGGPWGMALLAAYLVNKKKDEALESYLNGSVFAKAGRVTLQPVEAEVAGFASFMSKYRSGLSIEETAVKILE